jgi:DNA topoisomerase-1
LKRKKPVYAESSSDEDTPLASSPAKRTASAAVAMPGAAKATTIAASSMNGNGRGATKSEPDDDDRFGPDSPKKPETNGKTGKPPKKKLKEESDFDESSDDDKPIAVKKAPVSRKRKVKAESNADASSDDEKTIIKKPPPKPRAKKVKKEDTASGSETPKSKKRVAKAKEENASPSKAKGKKKEKKEEEEEEVFRWWEANPDGDGSVKWQTLEHNGVIFPPPYEPLPRHVKMKYNGIIDLCDILCAYLHFYLGKEVDLPPAAEEVAGFYAAMLETDHAQDATFNKNFFEDWKKVMEIHSPVRAGCITFVRHSLIFILARRH